VIQIGLKIKKKERIEEAFDFFESDVKREGDALKTTVSDETVVADLKLLDDNASAWTNEDPSLERIQQWINDNDTDK